jgi:hypothetical protein
MRYLFGFLCVCALGLMSLVGCGEEGPECVSKYQCHDGNTCTADRCYASAGLCRYAPIDCRTTLPPLPNGYHEDCVSFEFDVCDPEAPEDQVCGAITIIDDASCSGDGYCLGGDWVCTSSGTCICHIDITRPPVS